MYSLLFMYSFLICSFRVAKIQKIFETLVFIQDYILFCVFLEKNFVIPQFMLTFAPAIGSQLPRAVIGWVVDCD